VTGVDEARADSRRDFKLASVGNGNYLFKRTRDIRAVVKRLDESLASLRQVFRVFHLDVCGILQHVRREVTCGRRAIDRTFETVAHEKRDASRVVDVRVRQHQGRQLLDADGQFPVFPVGFLTMSLEHAAIECDETFTHSKQVT